MQESALLEPRVPSKDRGVTLFERINRLSVLKELVPSTKIVNLDLFDNPRDSAEDRFSLKKDLRSSKKHELPDKPEPILKVTPCENEKSPRSRELNLKEINEHYDVGDQNVFFSRMRKSIGFLKENSQGNEENVEGVEKNDENFAEEDFQTRKRKRSIVFSRRGVNELVILSSRNEMQGTFVGPLRRKSAEILENAESPEKKEEKTGRCARVCKKICAVFARFVEKLRFCLQESKKSFTKVLMAREDLREIDMSTQKSRYVLLPTSFFQRNWDLLLLLCIFYEFLLIPLKIAYNMQSGAAVLTFFEAMIFLISCVDIFLSFSTGFVNFRGVLELNPMHIQRRYKETFLIHDFLAALPINFAFQLYLLISDESSSNFLNATRENADYLQLILLHKVFRFSRLKRILRRFDENTLYNPALVRITKSTIGLVFLWHWIACFYWFIAITEGFSNNSWTPDPVFLYRSTFSQYNYSLLWALTVTVGVGVDISPVSNVELVYSGVVIVIGVALYGILLGSTSSAFLSIDDQDADLRKQLDSLNNFMRKKKVSFDLQKRIEENLKYLWSSQQTLNVSNQWFLEGVHSLLKLELCIHLNKQFLDKIPMFQNISFDCLVFLLNLLESRIYLPEEYVICEGSYSQNLYFIQTGILEIIDKRMNTRVRLYDGDFFGEQSLFVLKKKTADVKCLTYSELLIISKGALAQVINKFPDFAVNLFNYLKEKDGEKIKRNAKNRIRYWLFIKYAFEIAKFLKREAPALTFEELFVQKKREILKENREEIKMKVIEAFKKSSL